DPGYDYLIISHPTLIDAVRPLADYHRRNGRHVALVDVDQLYDQFNGGIIHPSAIRDFIVWGDAHWQLKPRYMLLGGTARFDIRKAGKPVSMQPASFDPGTGVPFGKRADAPDAATEQASRSNLPNRNLIPTWQYASEEGQSASDNYYVALKDDDYRPQL